MSEYGCDHQWRDTLKERRINIVKSKYGYTADSGWEQRCIKCNATRLTLVSRENFRFKWDWSGFFPEVIFFWFGMVSLFLILVISSV